MQSGIHPSLQPNRHHQITYIKFNLKIHYPPPYEHEIWHNNQANVNHTRKAFYLFPWEKVLRYLNINHMISLFYKTVKNITSNYILIKLRDPLVD